MSSSGFQWTGRGAGLRIGAAFLATVLCAACTGGGEAGSGRQAEPSGAPAPPLVSSHGGPGSGGGRSGAPPAEDARAFSEETYVAGILEARRRKDELFRSGSDSPVPPDQRVAFKGLDYYPVDVAWRMVLPLRRDPDPPVLTFVSNMGEKRTIRREGWVEFARDGKDVRVAVFHILDDPVPPDSLWIPFADAGSGRETYPGGRYIDTRLGPGDEVLVDFNEAYNPYCAYGWAFSCPLAPAENRLKIPVQAGEKGFHQP